MHAQIVHISMSISKRHYICWLGVECGNGQIRIELNINVTIYYNFFLLRMNMNRIQLIR